MAWTDRAHFLAVASQAMRRVLVDHARSKRAGKRWGHTVQVPLEEGAATSQPREVDLILLDESLRTSWRRSLPARRDWWSFVTSVG